MAARAKRKSAYFESHFPTEENARDFAFRMIDLGYSARKQDPSKDWHTYLGTISRPASDNAVFVACTVEEFKGPELIAKVKEFARKYKGRCVGGGTLPNIATMVDMHHVKEHLATAVFDN